MGKRIILRWIFGRLGRSHETGPAEAPAPSAAIKRASPAIVGLFYPDSSPVNAIIIKTKPRLCQWWLA